jgi:hypothetical protein
MRDLGLAVYDLQKDGVFGTQIEVNKFLFLNTNAAAAQVMVDCHGVTVHGATVILSAAKDLAPKSGPGDPSLRSG